MERLRRLHYGAAKKSQVRAITLGIAGTLLLGAGMSFIMTNLGEVLGSYRDLALVIGLAAGLLGMLLVALACPVYERVLNRQRRRIAPKILRITDELMK